MKIRSFIITLIMLGGLAAHAQDTPAYVRDNVNAVLWFQRSGEYKALCYQAYNLAHYRLDELLKTSKNRKPKCVIVDIDETVLDNSPFQGHEIRKGVAGYNYNDWLEWTAKAQADTVPGALDFLKYAAEKGVQTIYITNREKSERTATLKNLQRFNFPFADEAHLLTKDATSDKQPRRELIGEKYEILLLCGDNLNDFTNLFYKKDMASRDQATNSVRAEFGKRFIVLPNPMYGDWEPPVYDNKRNLTEVEKADIRLKALKGY